MSEQSGNTLDTFKDAPELSEVEIPSTIDKEAITERIMDQVIDAAERDEPIEQTYEQSHERKGDASHYQPMQSVGSILKQTAAQQGQQTAPIVQLSAVDPNAKNEDVDYNQALAAFTAFSAPTRSYKWPIIIGSFIGLVVAILVIFWLLT